MRLHPVPVRFVTMLGVVALLLLPPAMSGAATTFSDTISVEPGRSTSDVALDITALEPGSEVDTVLIGRDDLFADALAAGVMSAPLLLVPSNGPVSAEVLAQLERLDPDRVVLLGGEQAVAPAVEDALTDAGHQVVRRFGASRVETAVQIAAQEAADATVALLARADAGAGSTDPTRAFADALAASAWAAANGYPVLLTQTDELASATRSHLEASGITRVVILGGTAAVSDAVEQTVAGIVDQVDRVAGTDRFDTAVRIAVARGFATAASAPHVIVVEGRTADSWAGGFAVASRAARLDAPVVLSGGDALPAATAEWLGGAGFAGGDGPASDPVLTCVTEASACAQARTLRGLPDAVPVTLDPAPGAPLPPGGTLRVTIGDGLSGQVSGSCLAGTADVAGEGQVDVADDPVLPCDVAVVVDLGDGSLQTTTERYADPSLDGGAPFEQLSVRHDLEPSQEDVGDEVVALSSGGGTAVYASGNPHLLPPGDELSGLIQIWRRSLGNPGQQLLTVNADGEHGNANSGTPSVSADGARVLFESFASNLVPGDTNGARDVFLWEDGQIRAISTAPDSTVPLEGGGESPMISDDGQWAILTTFGGFVPGVDPVDERLVLVNLDTDERVLVDSSATSMNADLSADGRFVVFERFDGVNLFDRDNGTREPLTVTPGGFEDTASRDPSISADGGVVVFHSSTDLIGDGGAATNVYAIDTATSDLRRVNPEGVGTGDPFGISGQLALSGDGSTYAVTTSTDIDGAGDEWQDTFAVDLATSATTRLSTAPGDPGGDTFVGGAQGLSGDGARVVLLTNGFNLPLSPGIEDLPGIDPALHAVAAALPSAG